ICAVRANFLVDSREDENCGNRDEPEAARIADAIPQLGYRAKSFCLDGKPFGLLLGAFFRALFHHRFLGFLLSLFLRVHAFTHMRPSL
ncbi:MAG: hypothetical protein ACXWWP_04720, partial [Candidatus Binatia bacterium]